MATSGANVTQTLLELTSTHFQKLCQQLVSRGSLKEGTCSTAEELLTVLTSSLGKNEAYNLIKVSLEEIGNMEEKQSADDSAQRELRQLKPVFRTQAFLPHLRKLMRGLEEAQVLSFMEMHEIVKENPKMTQQAESLIALVLHKGPQESSKTLSLLKQINPTLFKAPEAGTSGTASTSGTSRYDPVQLELQQLWPEFISRVSFSLLCDLLDDLDDDHVLSGRDRQWIMSQMSFMRQQAESLIDLLFHKGPETSRKTLFFLKQRHSALFKVQAGTSSTSDTSGAGDYDSVQIEFQQLRPDFVKQVSFSLLYELLLELSKADVLSGTERRKILFAISRLRKEADFLIDLLLDKDPEASRKMLFFLKQRDPAFFKVPARTHGQLLPQERLKLRTLEELPALRSDLMSQSVLFRLMNSLEVDHVLSSGEKSMIISSNPDIRSMVFHLNHVVLLKGSEASKKMLHCLSRIEPRLFGHCLVEQYKGMLVDLVRDVDILIKDLNTRGVAVSDEIKAIHSPQEKMSKVIDHLKSVEQKLIFYSILEEREPRALDTVLRKMETEQPWMKGDFEMVTERWFTEIATVAEDEWTKLEPEVSCDDGVTWCSFLSVPGKYECSVSGLRWSCKDSPLSFKYRFGKWWEHKNTMEALQHMAAGPLLDITVTDGRFDEVYLPHWICTAVDPTIFEKFAVLHSDNDGVSMENVPEVTPSHVKLPHTDFSARGVLTRIKRWAGFLVSLKCKVFIYKTKKAFLTLHVYLIPSDPALEAELQKTTSLLGYERIMKSYPQGALEMDDQFNLKTDVDGATISPKVFKLTYEDWDPNFFEVFIKKPGEEFTLILENASGPVWSCDIRRGDYSGSGSFVPEMRTYDDELLRVRTDFMERVSAEVTSQLLDDLLGVDLNDGEKDAIAEGKMIPTHRARALIDTVRRKGPEASRRMIFHFERRDRTLHALLGLPSVPHL
ncbi:uncharacterized protein LOC109515898 isoform X3 [Hippocampus comes]|uniref:uncharacterized protein LOC109515898 isoform X3 n=1 Tax=Hippocampus comes TaxID=109280 RepID=UPI00094E81C8|nr:PREDICTED: uncharacterized protein LOC109515898 isoform X3 [Hippocampus comes]